MNQVNFNIQIEKNYLIFFFLLEEGISCEVIFRFDYENTKFMFFKSENKNVKKNNMKLNKIMYINYII